MRYNLYKPLSTLLLVLCLDSCTIETNKFEASNFSWTLDFLYVCAQLAILLVLLLTAGSVFAGLIYIVFKAPKAVRIWLSKKYPDRFSPPKEEVAKIVPSYRILRHAVVGKVLYEPQWWNRNHQVTHTREVNYPDEPLRTETYTVPAPRWESIVERSVELPTNIVDASRLIEAHSLTKAHEDYWIPRTLDGNTLKPRNLEENVVVEITESSKV